MRSSQETAHCLAICFILLSIFPGPIVAPALLTQRHFAEERPAAAWQQRNRMSQHPDDRVIPPFAGNYKPERKYEEEIVSAIGRREGYEYVLMPYPATRLDASAHCKSQGWWLASPTTQNENDDLKDFLARCMYSKVGAEFRVKEEMVWTGLDRNRRSYMCTVDTKSMGIIEVNLRLFGLERWISENGDCAFYKDTFTDRDVETHAIRYGDFVDKVDLVFRECKPQTKARYVCISNKVAVPSTYIDDMWCLAGGVSK